MCTQNVVAEDTLLRSIAGSKVSLLILVRCHTFIHCTSSTLLASVFVCVIHFVNLFNFSQYFMYQKVLKAKIMYFIRISFIKLKNITVIPVNKHILFAIPVCDGDVSQNRQIISLNPIIKRPFVTNPRHLMTRVDFLRPSETNGHSGR